MVAEKHQHYTAEEFEAFIAQPSNVGRSFELINGEIVEKMPTQLHGLIAGFIATFMNLFILNNPLGWVMVEARYKLPDDDENDYIPDVSFVSKAHKSLVEKGAAPYMPDIAVEIKSPDETLPEMRKKAAYYLDNGSQLVWLVYTEKRMVIVLTADSEDILREDDILDGGSVLPGFTLPVRDIFPKE